MRFMLGFHRPTLHTCELCEKPIPPGTGVRRFRRWFCCDGHRAQWLSDEV